MASTSSGVNVSNGVSDTASLKDKVGYEATENGFKIFCCECLETHYIELEE